MTLVANLGARGISKNATFEVNLENCGWRDIFKLASTLKLRFGTWRYKFKSHGEKIDCITNSKFQNGSLRYKLQFITLPDT